MKKTALPLIRAYKKLIFNLSASHNPLLMGYYKFFYKPKAGTIEDFLDQFSRAQKSIFALQIGANDGLNNDPIHKFIRRDQWSGILIEPQKYVYEKFLKKLHANSPHIITLNAALDRKEGRLPIYKISFSQERWASGLTSFVKGVLEKKVRDGSIDRLAQKHGLTPPARVEDYIEEEYIKVISPQTLKEKYQLKNMEVLMVDTEGYDFEILKMIFEAQLYPMTLIFEHTHLSKNDLASCDAFLDAHDYSFIRKKANTLAVKNDTVAQTIFKRVFGN